MIAVFGDRRESQLDWSIVMAVPTVTAVEGGVFC